MSMAKFLYIRPLCRVPHVLSGGGYAVSQQQSGRCLQMLPSKRFRVGACLQLQSRLDSSTPCFDPATHCVL